MTKKYGTRVTEKHVSKHQRANKVEQAEARRVLRGMWKEALEKGEFRIDFIAEGASDAKYKADTLFNALSDNRKTIRRNKSKYWDTWIIIDSCMLCRPNDYTVLIKRKKKAYSNRTALILEVGSRIPSLGLSSDNNPVDDILKDFPKPE